MRIKICGITRAKDGVAAAEAGADAIGLNFVGGPRRIEPAGAREILRELPPLVTPVALVRAEPGGPPNELMEVFAEFRVSHLQVYGSANRAKDRQERSIIEARNWAPLIAAGFRILPVLAVQDAGFAPVLRAWSVASREWRPSAVVLDAFDPAREGGTGRAFEWSWAGPDSGGGAAGRLPILLAGGLKPENVAEAVRVARPYGVDVSSGVEMEGSPGIKDQAKMVAFVKNARAALDSFEI